MKTRFLTLAAALAVAGCDMSTVQTPPRDPNPFMAAAPTPGTTSTFYTHERSEKLYRQAKYAEAEALCKQAIAEIEKGPANRQWEMAAPLIDLTTVYMRQARYEESKGLIERAEKVLDPSRPEQALLLGRLGINKGWRLYTFGSTELARRAFEDARTLLEKNGTESIDLAEILNNLALMYDDLGDDKEDDSLKAQARVLLLKGWQMRRRLTGEVSPETAESVHNLGLHLLFSEPFEDKVLGLEVIKESLDLCIKVYGEDHPETAGSRSSLAMAHLMEGEKVKAEKEARAALATTTKFFGPMHPDRAGELLTLGRILQAQTQFDEAEKCYIEARAVTEKVYGAKHPRVANPLRALLDLYGDKGDPAKVLEIQKLLEQFSDDEF